MHNIALEGEVEVTGVGHLALQEAAFGPPELPVLLLVHDKLLAQRLGVSLDELGELVDVHSGVELEIALEDRRGDGVLDVVHEHLQVMLRGIHVVLWVVEIRGDRGDEFGAGGEEEFLEDREGFGTAALHPGELIAVFLAEGSVDSVIETDRAEGYTDRHESVHLVVLLGDL